MTINELTAAAAVKAHKDYIDQCLKAKTKIDFDIVRELLSIRDEFIAKNMLAA